MLIKLNKLVQKYNLKINGVFHIGAHLAEELKDYREQNIQNVVWVEGNPELIKQLKDIVPKTHLILPHLVSDKEETINFYVTNNGQSSSILNFGLHEKYHPHVKVVKTLKLKTVPVYKLYENYNIDPKLYNFLNLDIQGVELSALKSMKTYLNYFDYIYTEVNEDYVYKNNALITEIDDYLKKFNFVRVETNMTKYKWGDAFYMKK